jgi:hypothetical protein
VIGFCWLAMVARRNFGPFAIVTAPVLSKYLSSFLDDWLKKGQASDGLFNKLESMIVKSNQEPKPALRNLINVSLLLLLMIAVGWKTVDVNQIEFINEVESKVFPVRAVEWMAETDYSGKLFNNYNWGGYIIWHLPDTPLFVDGRTDLFGDQILTDYMAVITVDENWQEVLDEYEIDTLLVPQGSLISKVAESTGWKIIYRDEIAVIMQN